MKRYESYKDSGVEWIGEVPSHWEIIRGKYTTDILPGFPFDSKKFTKEEGYIGLIRIRDIFSSETEMNYSGKYSQEAVVKNGDVLIGMDGDFNVAKWNGEECLLNQRVCKIMHTNIVLSDFMYYSLPWLLKCINDVTYATTVKHLSTFDILRSYFAIPSKNEQQCIVSFLDSKCGEVDKVISTQEKRIALLQELKQSIITHAVTKGLNPNVKMKDSGIEWIGEVPEHWDVLHFRHTIKHITTGLNPRENFKLGEGNNFYITIRNFQNGKIFLDENCDLINDKALKIIHNRSKIQKGDLLFASISENGKAVVIKEDPINWDINESVFAIRPNNRLNSDYLFYVITDYSFYKPLRIGATGTTFSSIKQDQLKSGLIVCPPFSEQIIIASYLDKRCASIDASISKAQREIELLQEYKQSLITEVVTGKRKVC